MSQSLDWRTEGIASLTVWAVLVPSALAYSSIVGVDPMVGLIGVPLALAGYLIAGSPTTLIVGADAAVSVLVGTAVAGPGAAAETNESLVTLSLLVALIYFALRILRMGWVADMVPQPVLKGFVQGLIWVTVIGQIPAMLGLTIENPHSGFFGKVVDVFTSLNTIQVPTALVGVGTAVLLFGLSAARPAWPSALIALVAAGVAVAVFNLGAEGVDVVGRPVGALVDLTLPRDPSLARALLPAAGAIVILGFTESLGASQLVSESDGSPTRPNQELQGLGAANFGVALGGSYPVTGALSKTAVAVRTGGKSRATPAGVIVLSLLTIAFLRPLLDYLAQPALAASVVWAMFGLIDLPYLTRLYAISRLEFIVSALAFAGVLFFGVMAAVVIATLLSLAFLARHVSRPPTSVLGRAEDGKWHSLKNYPDAEVPEGLLVWRIDGPLAFINARYLGDKLQALVNANEGVRVVIVDATSVTAVDTTGVAQFGSVQRRMQAAGVELWLAGADDRVYSEFVKIAGSDALPTYKTLNKAVSQFSER